VEAISVVITRAVRLIRIYFAGSKFVPASMSYCSCTHLDDHQVSHLPDHEAALISRSLTAVEELVEAARKHPINQMAVRLQRHANEYVKFAYQGSYG
jgi:CHASE3 domain sensor protein